MYWLLFANRPMSGFLTVCSPLETLPFTPAVCLCLQEVQSQIYSTLYDYPCLKECGRLRHYIEECVTVAWKLSVQNPPCKLEFDCQQFKPDRHVRFHSSNGDSETVRQYIWPALLDSKTGTCYQKGVVIT